MHTLHGLPEPFLTEAPPSLKARVAYRGLDRGLRRFTDVLVTPSHAMARLLADRIGYDLGELVVVPNGVDVPETTQPRGDRVGTDRAAGAGEGSRVPDRRDAPPRSGRS